MGRTHGVHAEPTTFGLKLALWYSEMKRNSNVSNVLQKGLKQVRLVAPWDICEYSAREVGSIMFAQNFEFVLKKSRHRSYLVTCKRITFLYCINCDKYRKNLRQKSVVTKKSETREVEEFFARAKGSSVMPHKTQSNRIWEYGGTCSCHQRTYGRSLWERELMAWTWYLTFFERTLLFQIAQFYSIICFVVSVISLKKLWRVPRKHVTGMRLSDLFTVNGCWLKLIDKEWAVKKAYDLGTAMHGKAWDEKFSFSVLL